MWGTSGDQSEVRARLHRRFTLRLDFETPVIRGLIGWLAFAACDSSPSADHAPANPATSPDASSVDRSSGVDADASGVRDGTADTGARSDSGPAPGCGDRVCDSRETCSSCSVDCGACPQNCSDATVLCVDDTSGPTQEFSTIAAAAAVAKPGDTVLVHSGRYAGVQIEISGQPGNSISYRAAATDVIIDNPVPSGGNVSSSCVGGSATGICFVGSDNLEGIHDVTIEGFRIDSVGLRCIAAHSANPGLISGSSPHQRIIIRGVTCLNALHEGFYLSEVYDSLVENSEIINPGSNGDARGHGIYMANAGCDKTILRGNFIHWDGRLGPPEGAGIHFNGDESVTGNGGGDGVIRELVVESNTIRGANHNGLNMDGVQDSLVRNNLIYGIARNAVVAYQIDGSAGPKGMRIVNNTFVVPSSSGGAAIKLEQDLGGHVLFNNILINEAGGPAISVGSANLVSDYNAVTGAFVFNDTDQTFTEWKSAGRDTHSVLTTSVALFLSIADFHLSGGASAADVGVSVLNAVAAPVTDLEGSSRPKGAGFDLGALERP